MSAAAEEVVEPGGTLWLRLDLGCDNPAVERLLLARSDFAVEDRRG